MHSINRRLTDIEKETVREQILQELQNNSDLSYYGVFYYSLPDFIETEDYTGVVYKNYEVNIQDIISFEDFEKNKGEVNEN